MNMHTLIAVVVTVCSVGAQYHDQLSAEYVSKYSTDGLPVLQAAIAADNAALDAALAAFVPVNASCRLTANQTAERCIACIKRRCKARGESVCSNFLTDTIQFFADDVPNLFVSTIPNTAIYVGSHVVNIGETGINEIKGFALESISGLQDFGVNIGDVAVDIGKGFVGGVSGVITDIGDVGTDFGNAVVDIGKNLGGLWGKRQLRRRSANRPTSEPNCNQLQSNSQYYCMYYNEPSLCADCGTFNADQSCVGWTEAVAAITTANDLRNWLNQDVPNPVTLFRLNYFKYNYGQFRNGGFANGEASYSLFGRDYVFNVPESIKTRDESSVSGEILMRHAIAAARAAFAK